MGALGAEEVDVAVGAGADVVAWDEVFVGALADAAARAGTVVRAHVKLDTGMGRLGTRDPRGRRSRGRDDRRGAGAGARGRDDPLRHRRRPRRATSSPSSSGASSPGRAPLKERHPDILVHAANSPATLREPAAHFDLVRCGVAVYGMDPFNEDPAPRELEPALALESYVAALKPCAPGESAGYGRRFIAERDTVLGVLPIGYGDGVRRALTNNGEVLVGRRAGRRSWAP